jgi:hypothetical protein
MDPTASVEVRSIAKVEVTKLKTWFSGDAYAAGLVARFEDDPKELELPKPVEAPPGQPIGSDELVFWPF